MYVKEGKETDFSKMKGISMSTQGAKAKYKTSKMEIEVPTVLKEAMERWEASCVFGDRDDNRMANLMMTMFVAMHFWWNKSEELGRDELMEQYGIAVAEGPYQGRLVIGEQFTVDGSEPFIRRPGDAPGSPVGPS